MKGFFEWVVKTHSDGWVEVLKMLLVAIAVATTIVTFSILFVFTTGLIVIPLIGALVYVLLKQYKKEVKG